MYNGDARGHGVSMDDNNLASKFAESHRVPIKKSYGDDDGGDACDEICLFCVVL